MVSEDFLDFEENGLASEPMAVYGKVNMQRPMQTTGAFEGQWQRALTVEEFRERCKQKLRAAYD